ncbi:hypothetical protein Tco_0176684, partial [Tanacetum coccineum]
IGRVVPLLPVSTACSESELEATMDKLFDEGGSVDQGDSAASGGHDAEIELVTIMEDVAVVTAERPICQRGKSLSVLKELLASSILNVEVGVEAVETLPLITSSISTTPEREGGDLTDYVVGPNLPTIGSSKRFVISSDSSHHSSTNSSGAEVDSIIRSAVLPPIMTRAVVTSHAVSVPSILVPETVPRLLLWFMLLCFMTLTPQRQQDQMLRFPLILLNKIFRWVIES